MPAHPNVTLQLSPFAEDVLKGLSAPEKFVPSKYFYDDAGSRLFQDIMQMPEYYLTRSEMEILSRQPGGIVSALQFEEPFNIVELGAGDALKTQELLKYLHAQRTHFTYIPIDISEEAMQQLQSKLSSSLPDLRVKPEVGDYFDILKQLNFSGRSNLFLFLGSNIGNYEPDDAKVLLGMLYSYMQPGDKLLIGFDLQKNPAVIKSAYDDASGITRSFNLNLLSRMNRELDADFREDQFDFYSYYNPYNGEVRSMLVSLTGQEVTIGALQKTFRFQANELIRTELSKKYTLSEIENLAQVCGYKVEQHFFDGKRYFTDSLWRKE
ncbi:L-histidine N(alpha)-methyltransferase [Telluribacter sp.]|jgi:dimethylhistidine N-methyltransferase|uniref:L-histidine N(alpha)-methyltransferase n=1 Tax=Telluribacter sp. TaxID=1978767 RepID=UPI002E130149|nr:L-histidine N(alpha)-methyltransferase [Telluribacter sp.]